ncbi:wall-associated receptor kinase 2-like [Mercurialis annua]|uniref:wall-associated receptor kinase 2-like n=1 Tax=Mercurialis annua TaxID=3986 RepID=UPI0021605E0A|nr:wall-associated receptor kinase 2-like [Mercurialis annua]
MKLLKILALQLLFLRVSSPTAAPSPAPTAAPPLVFGLKPVSDCRRSCGNVTIPFPFGMEPGCYLDDNFHILCNDAKIPILAKSINDTAISVVDEKTVNPGIKILDISINGELRVSLPVSYQCSHYSSDYSQETQETYNYYYTSSFPLSYTRNKFTLVGCEAYAYLCDLSILKDDGSGQPVTCTLSHAYCDSTSELVNGSCSGIGCHRGLVPKAYKEFSVTSMNNPLDFLHPYVLNFSPCSFVFLVEDGYYNFTTPDLVNLKKGREFPVILDWAVGDKNCEEAKKAPQNYACRDKGSVCYDVDNGSGYRCNCSRGFHGNPYLENGCQDVNECVDSSLNQCIYPKSCINGAGYYACSCLKGYTGDGKRDGKGCISPHHLGLWPKLFLGMLVVILVGVIAIFVSWIGIKRRTIRKIRKKLFNENGGLLLQEMLSKSDQSSKLAMVFSESELKKATNDFNESEIVGRGGNGIVYKGTLKDGRIVAIKVSKMMDRSQITQFINEVIVLSQVKHPHVVKLLGCCLETPVPLLVYEFITNNTLYHHLHDEGKESSLSWKTRLRIAAETAGALAHMHYETCMQIIHRDIKSANILLDDEFTAKISDFGISRLVTLTQTHFCTLVQGTIGYIDPHYYETGLLNEKSDVYSFGVILAELLTGKPVVGHTQQGSSNGEKALAHRFTSMMRDGVILDIIEDRVKDEGGEDQLMGVAELANWCLGRFGDERPTMKQVKEKLDNYYSSL